MAARRTQIYLDDELRTRIERARARRGGTMADVVRDALDLYLRTEEKAARPLVELAHRWVGAWQREEGPREGARGGLDERARRLEY